jgi:hypothetical protein
MKFRVPEKWEISWPGEVHVRFCYMELVGWLCIHFHTTVRQQNTGIRGYVCDGFSNFGLFYSFTCFGKGYWTDFDKSALVWSPVSEEANQMVHVAQSVHPSYSLETLLSGIVYHMFQTFVSFKSKIKLLDARFEVFKEVKIWSLGFHGKDGGSRVLRNVGVLPQHYTTSQPRRRGLELISLFFGCVEVQELRLACPLTVFCLFIIDYIWL